MNRKLAISAILLGLSLAYFIVLASPDLTWVNVDSDAPTYIIAAEELRISHPSPGAPLFNLLNAGWIRIFPGDNSFWELSLLSAVASSLVVVVLYLVSRSVLPSLLWMASGVVVGQSTVVESYALVCLFMVAGYWLYKEDRRSWAYVVLGLGVMVHHLAGIAIIVFLLRDLWLKRDKTPILWALIGLPLLLYIPLANREPFIWIGGSGITDYYRYWFSQGGLLGGLAIFPTEDLLERVVDFSLVAVGSLGLAIPLIYLSVKRSKDYTLLALTTIPLVYYLTNLAPQTFTYTMPAVAFAGLLAVKASSDVLKRVVVVGCLILIGLNVQWYDIGRTLDSDMEAVRFYESLRGIPPNSVVWSESRGWEKVTVELFNSREGTQIDTVDLRKPNRTDEQLREDFSYELVYKTRVTKPKVYGVELERSHTEEVIRDLEELKAPKQ